MKTEYEKLKEEGYSEEEIKVVLGEVGKVGLTDDPLGAGRQDKTTVVTDRNGDSMRTSSIMMGYNKQGIVLPSGEYLSYEEYVEAIQKTLSEVDDNKILVCKKTGKKVDVEELVTGIKQMTEEAAKMVLGGSSDKITTQETKSVSVKVEGKIELIKKGLFMLGNGRVKLPDGEYISSKELEEALSNYVLMEGPSKVPPIPPVPPVPSPIEVEPVIETPKKEEVEEKKKVVKKSKTKWSLWPLITASVLLAAAAINAIPGKTALLVEKIQHKTLSYVATEVVDSEEIESIQDAVERMAREIDTGSKIDVDEGIEYYESSDHQYGGANDSGVFGKGIRESGEYDLEYISIICNGKIENVAFNEGVNLADFIDETAKTRGVSKDQLEVMLHIGGPVSGWVSLNDLVEGNRQSVRTIVETGSQYTGKVEDFEGNITIQTDKGETTLRVIDEDGKLLDDSSIVTGSDGEKYRLSSLKLGTQEERVYTETEEKAKLTFGIHNITQEEALLAGAVAVLGTLLSKRKEESEEEVTEEEYKEMLEKYNSNSKFVKILREIERKTPQWEKAELSVKGTDIVDSRISELYDGGNSKKV